MVSVFRTPQCWYLYLTQFFCLSLDLSGYLHLEFFGKGERQHSGVVISTVDSHQEHPGFDPLVNKGHINVWSLHVLPGFSLEALVLSHSPKTCRLDVCLRVGPMMNWCFINSMPCLAPELG